VEAKVNNVLICGL